MIIIANDQKEINIKNESVVEVGRVTMLRDGIVTVVGLQAVKAGEIVYVSDIAGGYVKALVLNLNLENVSAILLGNEQLVAEGATAHQSANLLKINSGLRLFGRVCNALGEFKDRRLTDDAELNYLERGGLVEKKATGIVDRVSVSIPLRTGTKAVDSLVPIGRGQRELIIGDRQTGKTSVAIDAIINHSFINGILSARTDELSLEDLRNITWFVYTSIGQKQSTVSENVKKLQDTNAFWYTSVIAATAAEPAPLQFLAPYTACAVGEFVRDIIGGHCVAIYDDLSKHAVAYRQMSLLLRRPPGREAFPGDVFYVHSRLLERAGSLNNKNVQIKDLETDKTIEVEQIRGTLTAFPIIETQAGDVSAYIPTNVISITDGQIFLETELFYKGIRPAINVGLSVSRVGSAAQPTIMKRVSGSLKIELAQFREIEGFAKLGANLDEHTQRLLTRGENIIEVLKQDVNKPLTTFDQTLSIFLGIGYSPAWLNDLLKIQLFDDQLVNHMKVRMSWLEALRLKTISFKIADIRPFIANVLNFSRELGFHEFMANNVVEDLTNSFIAKCPFGFFDDIINLYIYEFGLVKSNENSISLHAFKLFNSSEFMINDLAMVEKGTNQLNSFNQLIKNFTNKFVLRILSQHQTVGELTSTVRLVLQNFD